MSLKSATFLVLLLATAMPVTSATAIPVPPVRMTANDIPRLEASANAGSVRSQAILGRLYHSGEGVTKDFVMAAKWYRMAAERGDPISQFWLGRMYSFGEGLPQDDAQAAYWYRKAADQGSGAAQNALGEMYEQGKGVAQDLVQAYKWCELALATDEGQWNSAAFAGDRDRIAAKMTAAQIAEAKALVAVWKPAA